MKTPRYLLGAAVLFWGWQTGLFALGGSDGDYFGSATFRSHALGTFDSRSQPDLESVCGPFFRGGNHSLYIRRFRRECSIEIRPVAALSILPDDPRASLRQRRENSYSASSPGFCADHQNVRSHKNLLTSPSSILEPVF